MTQRSKPALSQTGFVTRDAREVRRKGQFPLSPPPQAVQQALIFASCFAKKPPGSPGGFFD
jgi:hypothetical protein